MDHLTPLGLSNSAEGDIAHDKGFKFHAQPQTGAYSCLGVCWIHLQGITRICAASVAVRVAQEF